MSQSVTRRDCLRAARFLSLRPTLRNLWVGSRSAVERLWFVLGLLLAEFWLTWKLGGCLLVGVGSSLNRLGGATLDQPSANRMETGHRAPRIGRQALVFVPGHRPRTGRMHKGRNRNPAGSLQTREPQTGPMGSLFWSGPALGPRVGLGPKFVREPLLPVGRVALSRPALSKDLSSSQDPSLP